MAIPGIMGLWQTQLGKETTSGTPVNCTTVYRGHGSYADGGLPVFPAEHVGVVGGIGRNYIPTESGSVTLEEIEATFEQLPYLLNMAIAGVTPTSDGGGSGRIRTWTFPTDAASYANTPFTYSCRVGDNIQAELLAGMFATSVSISGAIEDSWKMSADCTGKPQGQTTFTSGLAIPAVEDVIFGNTELFIDDVTTFPATTKITDAFLNFELTIGDIWKPQWTGEGTGIGYTFIKPTSEPEIELSFSVEHTDQTKAERLKRKSATPRSIRIKVTGSTLVTANTYNNKTIILDLIGSYSEAESLEDDGGNSVIPFTLMNHYHPTPATRGRIIVVNELATLP